MNMQYSWSIRLMLKASTFILSMVSIVFTVLLWASLPESFFMKCLTGLAGVALELCKFSMLPLSFLQLQKQKWFSGWVLLFLGSALFIVSIWASVSFLETGHQHKEQQSLAWQQRQETISQLDNNIRISQESAQADIRNGYRERGTDTLQQVDRWQKERSELLSQSLENSGQVVGLTEQKRFYAWLLLALLIDGCSVAGWSILAGQKPDKSIDDTVSRNDDRNDINPFSENQQSEFEDSAFVNRNIENQMDNSEAIIDPEIVNRISNGEYGVKFSIRGVMEKERLGYQKIKPVFDQLEDQGVIKQAVKGYELMNGSNYSLL